MADAAPTLNPWQSMITDLLDEGLTQQDICEATGLSQPTISELYKGVYDDPRVSTADALRTVHTRQMLIKRRREARARQGEASAAAAA